MIEQGFLEVFRSPVCLKPLQLTADGNLQTEDGEVYPCVDGILYLLPEIERGSDLGDGNFYDSNPFGERVWTDVKDVNAGVENQLKELLGLYPKDARIIDVGSGPGRISNYLSLHAYKSVISLDYSLTSLEQVKENSDNVCVWGNNLHLGIASDTFNLVISSGVIHHTPDPNKAFRECARIVKPGGKLYLRVYNIHSLYGYSYYTYGAMLRFLNTTKYTRFIVDLLGFKIYKLARKILFPSLPEREDRILKAKFDNLFMKNMVYFFTSAELNKLFEKEGMFIESNWKLPGTHRMHCYVAKKQA